jgi:acyl carrier protein
MRTVDAEALLERVREFLQRERGIDPDRVQLDARLKEDLELDSLDLVELAMGWELEYGLSLEDEQIMEITTISEAIDYALGHQGVIQA